MRVLAADYTVPFWTGSLKIVGGLGGVRIDQKGFLLPFTFLVWMCTLTALLAVLLLMLIPSYLPDTKLSRSGWSADTLSCVRVLLQQGEATRTTIKYFVLSMTGSYGVVMSV